MRDHKKLKVFDMADDYFVNYRTAIKSSYRRRDFVIIDW